MPSNGTEGEFFQDEWCAHCARDAQFRSEYEETGDPQCGGCEILANSMAGIQPDEWKYVNGIPNCSAFTLDPNLPMRCKFTLDMFN